MKTKATQYEWHERSVLVCADEACSEHLTIRCGETLSLIGVMPTPRFREDAKRRGELFVDRDERDIPDLEIEFESEPEEDGAEAAVPVPPPDDQSDQSDPDYCPDCGRYRSAILSPCECPE